MTAPKANRAETLLLGAVFLAVAAAYIWIASPESWLFSRRVAPEREFYNLLVDGFRSGKLSLNTEVPAALKALRDPYDPNQNGPFRLHDASYYHGAYYLYFGATPALVLFWPFRALTGAYLSQSQACVIFLLVAVAAAFGVLRAVKARFFPAVGAWAVPAAGLGIGLCSLVPCLVSRINVYEVAIASGIAFTTLSVACVYPALYGVRRLAWLALASLCYGLAVASRPSLAFGSVILVYPALELARSRAATRARIASAAALPLGCIAAGMLAYNFLRFGNPLEFGVTYQLTAVDARSARLFSLSNAWYNIRVCLLEPTRLSRFFPFVTGIRAPRMPDGYLGIEDPYGVLVNAPVLLFGFAALRLPRGAAALRPLTLALLALAAALAAPILLLCGANNRYLPEFAFPLSLLAAIGALAWVGSGGPVLRRAVATGWLLLLSVSVAFNLLAAFSHEDLLRAEHPAAYARLARALTWPSYLVRSAAGERYGPVTLTLEFPTGRGGAYEPLLVSGIGSRSDYLYAHYLSPQTVALGFEHTSHGGPSTGPIPVDYGRPHTVTVEAGFLYPPEGDPYFDRYSRAQAQELRRRLRIIVDGDLYLDAAAEVYDPVAREPLFGSGGWDRTALGAAFTGRILEHHLATPLEAQTPGPAGPGPVKLVLRLPPFPGRRSEPLVSTGVPGRGDLLYLTYLDAGHIALALDHWSAGGPESAPVPVTYAGLQRIEVSLGSLYPDRSNPPSVAQADWQRLGRRLFVRVNGTVVLDQAQPFYESSVAQIAVGRNAVGSSTSAPEFSGEILTQTSLDPSRLPPPPADR